MSPPKKRISRSVSDMANYSASEALAEDAELLPVIEAARAEWKEKGGRPWSEAELDLEESIGRP
jgi:hypothetical protein